MAKYITATYKENRREFGQLLMSDQIQDLADQGAEAGVAYARLYANGSRPRLPADYVASFKAVQGPIVTMGDPHPNPRRTARTVSEHRLAAAFEFGTGVRSGGNDGRGAKRPQGGYSDPYRILGRAGARVGQPPLRRRKRS